MVGFHGPIAGGHDGAGCHGFDGSVCGDLGAGRSVSLDLVHTLR